MFDDGSGKVFFEARPNQTMPAVFAGKELALLVLQPEGQYFTARTAASEFTLVLGGARAQVRRGDAALGDEVVTPRDDGPRLLATAEDGLTAGIAYGWPSREVEGKKTAHEQPVVFAPGSAALEAGKCWTRCRRWSFESVATRAIVAVGRNDAGVNDALATLRAEGLAQRVAGARRPRA